MIQRATNPHGTDQKHYGDHGVTVCERWRASFEAFSADMGPRPSPRHSIDRIDVTGNYEPGNCRWATAIQQANNKRNNHRGHYAGVEMTLAEAVLAAGSVVAASSAYSRVLRGWPFEAAVGTPPVPVAGKRPAGSRHF